MFENLDLLDSLEHFVLLIVKLFGLQKLSNLVKEKKVLRDVRIVVLFLLLGLFVVSEL